MEWGLGHASRCIPILNTLINNCQAEVIVAANASQAALIRSEFPSISIVQPPSYNIKYRKYRAGTMVRLALSLPHLAQTIIAEHRWILDFTQTHPIDAIISDNRYGCWHPQIPSYLITHQLAVKTPFGRPVNTITRKQVYRYINRFTACWVPDFADPATSLAGELSHPAQLPKIPVHYLGPITRIQPRTPNTPLSGLPVDSSANPLSETANGRNIQLLAILSGPEPQRSILEQKLVTAWEKKPGRSLLLLRGLPDNPANPFPGLQNAWVLNHLPADQLSQAIANASCILCRSGYSSVMDLVPHHKNIWMIPTPGQTEQEYLATYLHQKGYINTQHQAAFDLAAILGSA